LVGCDAYLVLRAPHAWVEADRQASSGGDR
jgi:hypothetical protein